jgi:hypothetical protein
VQTEIAWILTNVTGGSSAETRAVVDADAVPVLLRLLDRSPHDAVREQVMWALGNVACDSSALRDLVLAKGAMPLVLNALTDMSAESLVRTHALWVLSKLCGGNTPPAPFALVQLARPLLLAFLQCEHDTLLTDACAALCSVPVGDYEQIETLVATGVVPRFAELLRRDDQALQLQALRCLAHIASGGAPHVQAVVASGALPAIASLLDSLDHSTARTACWALANVAQFDAPIVVVIGVVPTLAKLARNSPTDVKKKARIALLKTIRKLPSDSVGAVADDAVVQAIVDVLATLDDVKLLRIALDCLHIVLRSNANAASSSPSSSPPPTTSTAHKYKVSAAHSASFAAHDGMTKLEALLAHTDREVCLLAKRTMRTFNFAASPGVSDDEQLHAAWVADLLSDGDIERLTHGVTCALEFCNVRAPLEQRLAEMLDLPAVAALLARFESPPLSRQAVFLRQLVNVLVLPVATPALQCEVLAVLTVMAGATMGELLMSVNTVETCATMLRRIDDDSVCERAIGTLCKLTADSLALRDHVLRAGVLELLLDRVALMNGDELARSGAVNLMLHMCSGKPAPHFSIVRRAVPVTGALVQRCNDDDLVKAAALVLSHLSDGPNDKIQVVVDSGAIPRLVQLLAHSDAAMQSAALRCIGNVVSGDEQHTQTVIDAGGLAPLAALLLSAKGQLLKETCWSLSNVTAGSERQIQAVFDAGVLPHIMRIAHTEASAIKSEAGWVIANAAVSGSAEHLERLVQSGAIMTIVELLSHSATRLVAKLLESLDALVTADASRVATVVECGGLLRVQALLMHSSLEVRHGATRLHGNLLSRLQR